MKSAVQIQSDIEKLQDQLAKAQAREREARVSRLLSALDSSRLSDEEAIAIILASAKSKKAGVENDE